MTKGVIYVATGPGYVDLALQSARSLRASNPGLAVDLFTDDRGADGLEIFDQVHSVPVVHPRAKLECMALSRFQRTLFLDADTLVVGDLGDLWGVLDRFDLALAHDVRRASKLIRAGLEVETPYAFPQLNSGVVLYRQSAAMAGFLADWLQRFRGAGVARDQIVLKDVLWSSDLRFYVLPPEFNLRRVTVLEAWEPLDAEVKIIHSHRLMDHLRVPGAARISDLETLLRVEREALAQEWRAVGHPSRINWFTR
ncbi:MAG: hypothetical protein WBN04_14570 [Paracoccaceae bacterium]